MQIAIEIETGNGKRAIVSAGVIVVATPLLEADTHETEVGFFQRELEANVVIGKKGAALGGNFFVGSKLLLHRKIFQASAESFLIPFNLAKLLFVAFDGYPAKHGS